MTALPHAFARIVGLLAVLGFAAAGCATGSGLPDADQTPGGADGQLGTIDATATPTDESSAEPTDTSTGTPEDDPGPTATSGGGFTIPPIVLTIPPALLLPWPSPADCLGYNPDNLTVKYTGTGPNAPLWQVVDGSAALLAFKTSANAASGLALARSYRKQCFIGRGTEAIEDVVVYWLDPVPGAVPVPNPDCLPHDPNNITVVASGSQWLVKNGSESVKLFATKDAADKHALVLRHYNLHCYIGRDYSGADRKRFIVEWFGNS